MMRTNLVFHGQNKTVITYSPSLSVSPVAVSLKADGSSVMLNRNIITVTVADASQSWSISKDSWITITGASLIGNDQFTITAQINSSGVVRNGTVTVSSAGCTSKVISVQQQA